GVRNGPRAVELATKACNATEWQNADFLDTLAAAHASARNFNEAVRWEKKALEVGFADKKDKKDAEARLRLYQAGKPYRDEGRAHRNSGGSPRARRAKQGRAGR